jgi:hypothetical protein
MAIFTRMCTITLVRQPLTTGKRWAIKLGFSIPHIQNPQILGLSPLSQIRRFLRVASSQIANPQIFMLILKFPNSNKILHNPVSKQS